MAKKEETKSSYVPNFQRIKKTEFQFLALQLKV